MEKFRTQLAEDSQSMQFSLDSKGGREFSLKKKSGVLLRSFDGNWKSRSEETGQKEGMARALPGKSPGRRQPEPPSLPMDTGEILDDNRFLIDFLNRLALSEWKLLFRAHCCRRDIQNTRRQKLKTVFSHFSVSVRFRSRSHPQELEVSEGSSEGLKFNLNGLPRRISETVDNYKNRSRTAINCEIPVVLQAGEGAILFHEILGHSLEADYVCQGVSPFTLSDLDRAIVPPQITIHCRDDRDPFFKHVVADDEGEACPSPLLVENGVLRRFISDYSCQRMLRLGDRGHARQEDFGCIPQPRMFATYVQPGRYPAAEIIASTPYGIYAREFGDGGLDFQSGRFYFNIRQSYLIEKGRLTAPVGNLTVGGRIREILNDIGMVGDDFKYDRGVSYCQKNGQILPVRVGQPTIKINRMQVSGGPGA